jgi:hypothetical protein
MRTLLTVALAVGVCLAPGGAARAGVYNTAEPLLFPVTWNFQQFQSALGDVRSIAVERKSDRKTLRDHYLEQVEKLGAKQRTVGLTVADRVNLGACYLRLMRFEEAARVLDAAQAEEPDNFMVLANLATANYLAGPQDPARLARAILYQQQALKAWPSVHAGFTAEQLNWSRRAERYFLNLLELRQQEMRLQSGRAAETLDDLFHVRFVGPGGKYEAGTLAPDLTDRLPLERVPIVSQLLLWLPFDNRLYWLMAELLNAQGDLRGANAIMNELVDARAYRPPELWAHRQVVRQAWLEAEPVLKVLESDQGPEVKQQLLWALAPREAGGAPGAGAVVQEAGWFAALLKMRGQPLAPGPAAAATKGTPPANTPWLPDWRTFVVGLATGGALTVLIGQQFRQSQARRGTKAQRVR